jgi:hypothetical protein
MIHNLTDKQLQALRWLVKQVRDGGIGESFKFVVQSTFKSEIRMLDKTTPPNYLDSGVLDALTASKILVSSMDQSRYTLTKKAYEIADFDFDNPEPDPINLFMREAYHLIQRHFNREELEGVCFELGFQPDWVFGDKTDWPLHLLLYLYRQNQLDKLLPILQKLRPDVDWPMYST